MFGTVNFRRKSAQLCRPRTEELRPMRVTTQDLFPYHAQIQRRSSTTLARRGSCKAPHSHPPRPPTILSHAPQAQSAARLVNKRTKTQDWNDARFEKKGARKEARAPSASIATTRPPAASIATTGPGAAAAVPPRRAARSGRNRPARADADRDERRPARAPPPPPAPKQNQIRIKNISPDRCPPAGDRPPAPCSGEEKLCRGAGGINREGPAGPRPPHGHKFFFCAFFL